MFRAHLLTRDQNVFFFPFNHSLWAPGTEQTFWPEIHNFSHYTTFSLASWVLFIGQKCGMTKVRLLNIAPQEKLSQNHRGLSGSSLLTFPFFLKKQLGIHKGAKLPQYLTGRNLGVILPTCASKK